MFRSTNSPPQQQTSEVWALSLAFSAVKIRYFNITLLFQTSLNVKKKFFLMFLSIFERERQSVSRGGAERGRHRTWSRIQAPSHQHRMWHRAQIHKLRDHDPSWSRTLNRLSHPGAALNIFYAHHYFDVVIVIKLAGRLHRFKVFLSIDVQLM